MGSMTAALIALLQRVSTLLLTNEFVLVISTNFSKVFDILCQSTLAKKLASMVIPDKIYNCLICDFDNRCHATRFGDITSGPAMINASVVQGSVIGLPPLVHRCSL